MKTFRIELSAVETQQLMYVYAIDNETDAILGVGSYTYIFQPSKHTVKDAYNEAFSTAIAKGYQYIATTPLKCPHTDEILWQAQEAKV